MNKNIRREYLAEAKKRMKSGYWQEVVLRRNSDVNSAIINGGNPEQILERYRREIHNTFGSKALPYRDEEKLFEKVKHMHAEAEVIPNPIGQLTDQNYYNSLDESGRERYIFELSAVYRRLVAKLNETKKN